ncbi:MAG: cytochrome c maturation protein CcmE [Chloroflexi bacterium]|nr:cytochrome c maturation protein CcmE [Chloroflexota bacterium]
MRRRKFVIAAIIVALALGYLGYRGFVASAGYYYEVSEFLAQPGSPAEKKVRVNGTVVPGTIEQQGLNLKFAITDGQKELPVIYSGAVPDSFRAGGETAVEGKLNSDGVFEAQTLMPKCPSKYVAK